MMPTLVSQEIRSERMCICLDSAYLPVILCGGVRARGTTGRPGYRGVPRQCAGTSIEVPSMSGLVLMKIDLA